MAKQNETGITWTDETWNPLVAYRGDKRGWHCEKISPACDNCYAAAMNKRSDGLVGIGTGLPYAPEQRAKLRFEVHEETLLAPLRWKKPRKIFVCSMTDLFGEWWTDEQIDRVFELMALTPWHTYQVLTKRPERMRQYITSRSITDVVRKEMATFDLTPDLWPLPNVWLGVTAENQEQADERIPLLLQTPAAVRFVSVEPMLGPVDLRRYFQLAEVETVSEGRLFPQQQARRRLHWVITGGESGPKARPSHPDWFRSLSRQCRDAGTAFFMKQITERGKKIPFEQWPTDLQVLEFPQ